MKIPNLSKDPTGKTWLLQTALYSVGYELKIDNWDGSQTQKALSSFQNSLETEGQDWQKVKASSFADLADVVAFKKCKDQGNSDMYCFSKGDNGIGAWGANTAQKEFPMCALPREIWKNANKSGGAKLQVRYNGIVVDGVLGDTMPSLSNIKNGAGIDLNPAFSKKLGLNPPFMVEGVEWRWV